MKIIYSPEFSGHVFLGLNGEKDHVMDAMVCDTMGLVNMLELRLGIHVEMQSVHYRTVKYFKAMSEYMKRHPGNALSASFSLSSLGTAEQALRWRDSLVFDNWQPQAGDSVSGRMDVLAGTEAVFDCPGLPDRMRNVLSGLDREKDDFLKDVEIELSCDMSLLHPAVVGLIQAMLGHGAKYSVRQWDRADSVCNRFLADSISVNGKVIYAEDLGGRIAESKATGRPMKPVEGKNLLHVSHLLQSHVNAEITLNKEDRSFMIYQFADEKAANEYFALKGDALEADVWVNSANKTLDNWLRMMGKPVMGSSMAEAAPQLLQLFVLAIDMMKEPLNIQSIISWLYAPMQPLGRFFGGVLADKVISEGGYRNNKCRQIVDDYISGKYTYHDKEEDARLSERELARRNQREEEKRKTLVKTYLPPFEAAEKDSIDVTKLRVRLNSLSGWARNNVLFLRGKAGNEGWCSQLESLAQMCDTFVLLLEDAVATETIDVRQVDSWVSTLFQGESFMQYEPQKGSRELIDGPAKMAAHSRRTVWMNFSGGEAKSRDCSFLYPSEREKMQRQLNIWDEDSETRYNELMQLMPFLMTDDQLILVVTDYQGGEITPKHPIMVRLESQIENLSDFIVRPNLNEEPSEDVNLVRNNNTQSLISFEHADLLRWPDHLSPTSLGKLVEYPLDYLMEYMLGIVSTGPGSISDVKTTLGNVAHAVIESLFAPRDGSPCSMADEIERRIVEEFDIQVDRQIDACGAILYLPENRLDAELMKEQLRKCLDVLLAIIRENRLAVTGCEHLVTKDMEMLENEKDWDMIGFIDMTLEDEDGHPVVFDFKWTSSKTYHRELLAKNHSTQLELYRVMLGAEKCDRVERTAYFLMPEGHLYSKEHFDGPHCTQVQPENMDNIVEQLRRSFLYRKKQLDNGTVEVGEGFPLSLLDYYNDTAADDLFPLPDDGGIEKENIFSNYKLFKK